MPLNIVRDPRAKASLTNILARYARRKLRSSPGFRDMEKGKVECKTSFVELTADIINCNGTCLDNDPSKPLRIIWHNLALDAIIARCIGGDYSLWQWVSKTRRGGATPALLSSLTPCIVLSSALPGVQRAQGSCHHRRDSRSSRRHRPTPAMAPSSPLPLPEAPCRSKKRP